MTIKQKIIVGFVSLLLLISVLGLFSFRGITRVNEISCQGMETLSLDMFLDEKIGEHLVWMNNLADQFLLDKPFRDEVNPHQCDFGQWYDLFKSDDSQIMKLHAEIDQPHKRLHNAGEKIKDMYESVDLRVDHEMLEAKIAHFKWMIALRDSWQEGGLPFELPVDPAQCAFGKWYRSYKTDDPEIKLALEKIKTPHGKLHRSAVAIVNLADESGLITGSLKKQEAARIFNEECRPLADAVMSEFDKVEHIIHRKVDKNFEARDIYVKEAQVSAKEIQEKVGLMQNILMAKVKKLSSSDQIIKKQAGWSIVLAIFLCIFIGALITFLVPRAVLRPIVKLKAAVIELGKGNFSTKVDVKSKDEIGVLAACFNKMAENLSGAMEKEKKLAAAAAAAAGEKKKAEELAAMNEELESTNEELKQANEELESTTEELRVANEEEQKAKEAAEKKAADLERFNKVAVGRELKMKELKARVEELEQKLKEKS